MYVQVLYGAHLIILKHPQATLIHNYQDTVRVTVGGGTLCRAARPFLMTDVFDRYNLCRVLS